MEKLLSKLELENLLNTKAESGVAYVTSVKNNVICTETFAEAVEYIKKELNKKGPIFKISDNAIITENDLETSWIYKMRIENIEECTKGKQMKMDFQTKANNKKRGPAKRVELYNCKNGSKLTFRSAAEAVRKIGNSTNRSVYQKITRAIANNKAVFYGYVWRYC